MRRIGLLTSGGDAPGMNAFIALLNRFAAERQWQLLGIREGFKGLLAGAVSELYPENTWGKFRYGGSLLGCSRLADFSNHLAKLHSALDRLELTELIVLGGNGSTWAASLLATPQRRILTIPATIDNDVPDSEASLGFDTALNTGIRMIDGIRDAGEAMPHLFALEVLGGGRGVLAQAVAEAGGADAVLLPAQALDMNAMTEQLQAAMCKRRYAIVITPEYYPDVEAVIAQLSDALGESPRFGRIGHAQRGGIPSARDRHLALEFVIAAVNALETMQGGRIVWRAGRAELLSFGSLQDTTNTAFHWRLPS